MVLTIDHVPYILQTRIRCVSFVPCLVTSIFSLLLTCDLPISTLITFFEWDYTYVKNNLTFGIAFSSTAKPTFHHPYFIKKFDFRLAIFHPIDKSSKLTLAFLFQHIANCILLLTANALGLTSYFVEEKQQRRAFLETRLSLEVKLVIEEQSTEQVSNFEMIQHFPTDSSNLYRP